MAYITIEGSLRHFFSTLKNPTLGDRLDYIKANDKWDVALNNREGYIKSISPLEITAKDLVITNGDSGSPVFKDSLIVGMISATGTKRASELTIVNISAIRNIFEDWQIPWQLSEREAERKTIPPPTNTEPVLATLAVIKSEATGRCATSSGSVVDNDLSTGWKCNGRGTSYLYFYFDKRYAVQEFDLYLNGETVKSNEDLPDGSLWLSSQNVDLSLSKLMNHKVTTSGGTWVTYRLKKNVVTNYICIAVSGGSVYTDAIYEIKIKGFNL